MLSAFTRLLPMAEKVIDRRTSLPILKEICIQVGLARVTDLETMLVMPVPEKHSYCVPVAILKKVLTTRPENLFVSVGEDQKVTISYGDHKVTYSSRDVADFPALPKEKFKPVGQWSRDVFQALIAQAGYCSRDELKPSLCGIFIEEKDGQIEACATDGHVLRLEKGLAVKDGKSFKGIIPVKPLQVLARWARGDTRVGMSQTHLRFSLPGKVVLYTRLINEKYPEIESVLPAEESFSGRIILDKEKMLALIKSARPFAEKPANLAILSLNGQQSRILAENTEENTQWEAMWPATDHHGKGIRIGFDLELLDKALKGMEGGHVEWSYTTPVSASVFRSIEEKNGSLTLLMPIRINEEEPSDEPERDH